MKRAVVCVATTDHYQKGIRRLDETICNSRFSPRTELWLYNKEPSGCPSHADKPYAFKAYAMKEAADAGVGLILWADACILPIRDMTPLWEKIERDGYWIARNGWTNYEWTADSAYPDLFPINTWATYRDEETAKPGPALDQMRELNRKIPHVVATSFGLNLKSDIGKAFLDEYYRLASETRAFCGPWTNSNQVDPNGVSIQNALGDLPRMGPCGPPDVRGHRHDQTAASVIAWRLGMKLTNPPKVFAYPPGTEETILLADGSYE